MDKQLTGMGTALASSNPIRRATLTTRLGGYPQEDSMRTIVIWGAGI